MHHLFASPHILLLRLRHKMLWPFWAILMETEEARMVPHLDYRQHLLTDSCRIRRELGYVEPVPLPEALSRTIVWELASLPEKVDLQRFDYTAAGRGAGRPET